MFRPALAVFGEGIAQLLRDQEDEFGDSGYLGGAEVAGTGILGFGGSQSGGIREKSTMEVSSPISLTLLTFS